MKLINRLGSKWIRLSGIFPRSDSGNMRLIMGVRTKGFPQIDDIWWLGHPSEKYDFVSWDADIPNISQMLHVWNIYLH